MPPINYVIITPARNEQDNISRTIESVVMQSVRPSRWVIVDDGSKDRTARLIDEAAEHHSWIRSIHRPDRGARKSGGGVIEAFYDGFPLVQDEPWEFLIKLDADLSFGPDYFAACFRRFAAEPRLGIAGGSVWSEVNGRLIDDGKHDPPFHVRGATKIYRRACWEVIAPLLQAPGWDTVDEVGANMHGWNTRAFRDLGIMQHKPTGAGDGVWHNWFKNGRANYITGYHPIFMLAKSVKRAVQKPAFVASLALWAGFCSGYLRRTPQVPDEELIRYLRQQQVRRLLLSPSIYG